MKTLINHSTTLLGFFSRVIGHHYIGKLLDYKSDKISSPEQSEREEVIDNNLSNVKNKLIELQEVQKKNTSLFRKISK